MISEVFCNSLYRSLNRITKRDLGCLEMSIFGLNKQFYSQGSDCVVYRWNSLVLYVLEYNSGYKYFCQDETSSQAVPIKSLEDVSNNSVYCQTRVQIICNFSHLVVFQEKRDQ